jgi:hypothetical protein
MQPLALRRVTSLMAVRGGQLGPFVQDAELAVFDDHSDDLAAVDAAEVDLDSCDSD